MKVKYILGFLLSLLLAGCSQDEIILSDETVDFGSKSSVCTTNEKAIQKYLARGKKTLSRSANDILVPYIVEGDTVMYIANYGDGWEVFSNDIRMPMVLMSSTSGSFYPISPQTPMDEVFYMTAKRLRLLKNVGITPKDTINKEWIVNGIEPCNEGWGNDGPKEPENEYEWKWLVSCPLEQRTIIETPKNGRLKTKWGQSTYFNQFTPYFKNNDSIHSYVGCMPVAVGQFLYFMHQEFGVPATTVTNAVYNSSKNTYSFTGSSSTVWNEFSMYNYYDNEIMKPTAIFLGYIGTQIGTIYGKTYRDGGKSDGSGTPFDGAIKFINSQTGLTPQVISVKSSLDCSNMLRKGYPVIMMANGNSKIDGSKASHAFLVDYYEAQLEDWRTVYVYQKVKEGEDTEESPDIPDDASLEYLESIYGRGNVRIEIETFGNSFYKCNWGWSSNSLDETKLSSLIPSIWYVADYRFDSDFKIYKF
ncbi:MAG: C10 family peptidase [Muribaculaceae bacterium]|nr:C10 family peptidase [Muribaculaceae bacterium]MDE6643576.1 C10 family peptidase [Muribaculaceae bacterium]